MGTARSPRKPDRQCGHGDESLTAFATLENQQKKKKKKKLSALLLDTVASRVIVSKVTLDVASSGVCFQD